MNVEVLMLEPNAFYLLHVLHCFIIIHKCWGMMRFFIGALLLIMLYLVNNYSKKLLKSCICILYSYLMLSQSSCIWKFFLVKKFHVKSFKSSWVGVFKSLFKWCVSILQDTEFPGIVARPIFKVNDGMEYLNVQYQHIRANVDMLNIIQIGLTLSDEFGNTPIGICTWQFNFKFNLS